MVQLPSDIIEVLVKAAQHPLCNDIHQDIHPEAVKALREIGFVTRCTDFRYQGWWDLTPAAFEWVNAAGYETSFVVAPPVAQHGSGVR